MKGASWEDNTIFLSYELAFCPAALRESKISVKINGRIKKIRLTFNVIRYIHTYMIKTFHCKDTQALFEGKCPRQYKAITTVAERKLQMLDDAYALEDLRVPPGNRLEALHGNRKGQWSIRINDQWRLCFRFEDGNAFDVEIVDYH